MKLIHLSLFFFVLQFSFAQKCETFKRELFHYLPSDVPDEINCIDEQGKKQGFWIHYTIQYNPHDIPDNLKKGDYVAFYAYGKYLDGKKIETWSEINNVHLIYTIKEETYHYYKDSIIIEIEDWLNKQIVSCNADSSVAKIKNIDTRRKDTTLICIICDLKRKKTINNCKIYYQNILIKSFPYQDFEFEFDKAMLGIIDKQKYKRILENKK